jgi:hypothetical protein
MARLAGGLLPGRNVLAEPSRQTAVVHTGLAGHQFEKAAGFPDCSILCLNIIVA